ncbi:MAG: Cytidylyltransferase-like, partial [Actinomycetota bacterium]
MIVAWNDLPNLAGKVAMVDGSFDPLHEGHIAYFSAAAELGWPLLCN